MLLFSKKKLLCVAVVFFWFAQYVYIPFQTPYLVEIGISSQFIGVITGTYGVSQMVLRLPVGIMADIRNRHKIFIITGGLSSGIASLFRIFLNSSAGFLLGNLFSGLASAMWISFMVMYMSYYGENEQQKATGRLVMANNIGMLLGFVVSTVFYDMAGMERICMMSVGGGGICAVLAACLQGDEEIRSDMPTKEVISICGNKRLIFFAILALIQQGVQMSTTMSFSSQIVKDVSSGSSMAVGVSSIIYMLSAVIFAQVATTGPCMRLGPGKCITAVFMLVAVYCLAVPHCSSLVIIYFLQIIPGIATGILAAYIISEAMKGIPAAKKSTAMGFFQAVYAIGMTVLPALCGKLAGSFNIGSAYAVLAIICVAAGIAGYVFYVRKRA